MSITLDKPVNLVKRVTPTVDTAVRSYPSKGRHALNQAPDLASPVSGSIVPLARHHRTF